VEGAANWKADGLRDTADPALAALPAPHFVLDLNTVRNRYAAFSNAFPDTTIFYALKANPDPALITTLASLGSGFEAASWFEIEQLLDLGISSDRILYGTAVKPRSHIERAARAGVDRFATDSAEDLRVLAKVAPGARVLVRVKLDDSASVFQMNVKFGAPPQEVPELLRLAHQLGLWPWGISFNVGSQARRTEQWANGVRLVAPMFDELRAEGLDLEALNLGGGFPAPYRDHTGLQLGEIAAAIAPELRRLRNRPQLILEPGRGLSATAMSLVTTIEARVERPDGPWLFLDCGVYNALYEALLHQGRTAYPVQAMGPRPLGMPGQRFVLAGPTGDGLDVVARDVLLPADLGVGERLLFENVGAYTRVMASSFNGFPVPPIHYTGA